MIGFRRPRSIRGRLCWALVLGLATFMANRVIQDYAWLPNGDDPGLDPLIKIFSSTQVNTSTGRPFVFVDIDEETYSRWGRPVVTPRDKLQSLLALAVSAGAAMIVVDIDVGRRSEGVADAGLERFLRDLEAAPAAATPAPPPILFVRRLLRMPGERDRPSVLPPSPFDSVVAASPLLHWTTSTIELGSDGVARRVRLWEAACRDGRPEILPSASLLAAAFISHNFALDSAKTVARSLASLAPKTCSEPVSRTAAAVVPLSDRTARLSGAEPTQRIHFPIPWTLGAGHTRPRVTTPGGTQAEIFASVSAQAIETAASAGSPATFLSGKIVTIGGSHAESRDIYNTPVGSMPGALVVINGAQSLVQVGSLVTPPFAWQLAMMGGLIIASVLLFELARRSRRYHPMLGKFVLTTVLIVLWYLVSGAFFQVGIWVDFVVPMYAVSFYFMLLDYDATLSELNELRRRLSGSQDT